MARFCGISLVVVLGVALTVVGGGGQADAQTAPVGLGTVESFAVLGGQSVTNTGPSIISGDLGVSPGTAISGFPPGLVIDGVIHANDAVAAQAQLDTTTAYDDAAGRTPVTAAPADLVGLTLTSGVYGGPTLALSGQLTLDAQGDPNAVWIFQSASTLITASASSILLTNGADPCNVYWQVGSSATLGTASTFIGTILALTSISAQTGATIQGRLLARNGSVTLDTNTVTQAACAPPAATTTTASGGGTATTAPGGGGGGGGGGGAGGDTGGGAGGTGGAGGAGGSGGGAGGAGDSGIGSGAGGTGADAAGRAGGELAYTGSPLAFTAITGGVVTLLGGAMLLAARRREAEMSPS
jgi:hypothetical protein